MRVSLIDRFIVDNVSEIHSNSNTVIIVKKDIDIKVVELILRDMNENVYDTYYPSGGLVHVLNANDVMPYSDAFDFNVGELITRCKNEGIHIKVYGYSDLYTVGNYIGQLM